MTPILRAGSMHDGTPIMSPSRNALAHAVSVGQCPMRFEVSHVSKNVEEVTNIVNELNTKVDLEAGMTEQLGKVVNSMRTETSSGIASLALKVGLNVCDKDALQESFRIAKANLVDLVKIRNLLRTYQTPEMSSTLLTSRVYLNAFDTWEQLYIGIEDQLRLSEEAALAYAMSRRPYPMLKQKKTSKFRATNLIRTKPHLLQRIEDAMIPL